MIELNGKYASAKIFTNVVDQVSLDQVTEILNQPFVSGQTVRMMPDIHSGKGCTIGTTMTVDDKVCPNLVGVDIGCGMLAVKLEENTIDFEKLDRVIRAYVPSGFDIHDTPHRDAGNLDLRKLHCASSCNLTKAYCSIGSLGGGNHFIEVDEDSDGSLWLVIHSGSRHLGLEVANYYQKRAIRKLRSIPKSEVEEIVTKLKERGLSAKIPEELKNAKSRYSDVPDDLCWCEGQDFNDYVDDMKLTQEYATTNRRVIANIILERMGLHEVDGFTTIHNYLDTDAMILRKGAVSAKSGERLIIPINMRDGSLICTGKGNPDWNYSAPHGAGRIMSRSEAREAISLDEFRNTMSAVWTTSVNASTIDESPMAYKPIDNIIDNIHDTCSIIDIIRPLYNFKASNDA